MWLLLLDTTKVPFQENGRNYKNNMQLTTFTKTLVMLFISINYNIHLFGYRLQVALKKVKECYKKSYINLRFTTSVIDT